MPRALITGLSGQDGSYLAELLLEKGYEVHGLVRDGRLGAAGHLHGEVVEHPADLLDGESIAALVAAARPDELYHLGATTHARASETHPAETRAVVAGGTRAVLAAAARHVPETRVFHASSAEVFGAPAAAPQLEDTPLAPRNPYGGAKAEALAAARAARDNGAWVANGIFYNHESPRRPVDFVTRKITWHAAAIAIGRERELRIGNLDARRDWGYAPEYVEGAWRALQADEPDDFVFATGVLHSVRDVVEIAFAHAGVPVEGHVVVDPDFVRPDEPVPIVGDASKARRVLGWSASKPFEEMIAEMVDHDMTLLRG